jgi:hypothetical protein
MTEVYVLFKFRYVIRWFNHFNQWWYLFDCEVLYLISVRLPEDSSWDVWIKLEISDDVWDRQAFEEISTVFFHSTQKAFYDSFLDHGSLGEQPLKFHVKALACEVCLVVRHHVMPLHWVVLVVQVYDALRHSVVDELPSAWEHI